MGTNDKPKILLKIIEWTIFVILIIILFLVASPILPTKNSISTHAVVTGSMEPEIRTGSVVFSHMGTDKLKVGDVIVFTSPENQNVTVVHRIVDVDEDGNFITKGDNNDKNDNWTVFSENVVGEVFFTIPYIGYLIDWLHTPIGFIVLIVLPAILVVISQIKKIRDGINEEVHKKVQDEMDKKMGKTYDGPPVTLTALLIGLILISSRIGSSYALFSDSVEIKGFSISTAGEETQTQDVIINEIMWTGSSLSDDDQWIELRNMTDHEIDIGKWTIENVRKPDKPALMIPASRTIPANGYFLIANHPETSAKTTLNAIVDQPNASIELTDHNGDLILRDSHNNIIDKALELDITIEGYHSLQRKDPPSEGLDIDNWILCLDPLCTDIAFWKTLDVLNYGTPGSVNIY